MNSIGCGAERKRLPLGDGNTAQQPRPRDTFTIADAYLFALTGWGKAAWLKSVYHAEIDLTSLENLRGWYARIRARLHVQDALAYEGLYS